MEDLARGERIRARRQALHLTQPAVVDLLTQRAGGQVVTLRGYQSWEAGGGIRWDNAKVLAEVLGVDAETLMIGGPYIDKGETPDPFPTSDGDIQDRLDRIERAIAQAVAERDEQADEVRRLLKQQSDLLDIIRQIVAGLGVPDGTTLQDHLVQVVRDMSLKDAVAQQRRQEKS